MGTFLFFWKGRNGDIPDLLAKGDAPASGTSPFARIRGQIRNVPISPCLTPLSPGDAAAAVDGEDLPGDVRRVRGEEQRRARDVLRRAHAFEDGALDDLVAL